MINANDLGALGQDILYRTLKTISSEDNTGPMAVNVYLNKNEQGPHGRLTTAGNERTLPMEVETIHIYADLAPLANWAHPVRHLFYERRNGELVFSEYANFPPQGFEDASSAFEPMHIPLVHIEPLLPATNPGPNQRYFLRRSHHRHDRRHKPEEGERYAILFSGNSNNRHLNDLEFLYRVLTGPYKFRPENIRVLNFDGTLNYNGSPQPVNLWPGDKSAYTLENHINSKADTAGFDAAFTWVAGKLKPKDLLLIHTNNHGGQNGQYGQPWLCGYPNFSLVYNASDFGLRIKSLPRHRSLVVSMEQCFSGAFMGPTINNSNAKVTTFASAVPANLSSMGGANFDPWAMSWIAALNGSNPGGSPLPLPVPGNPSTLDTFNYSNAVHVPADLPQFSDRPGGSGAQQHL
jgi:hypothetical protein